MLSSPLVPAKKPFYINKWMQIRYILIAIAVFVLLAIFVVSQIQIETPVIIMTAHDYSNIVAFNAESGEIITDQLLDLSYQKHFDLFKRKEIQFRSVITRHYNQITVANGRHSNPFIATFDCNNNHNPGWKLNEYFAHESEFVKHPYGLTWNDRDKWWIFTTQDTSSLFIYDRNGKPMNLPGMKQYFPGSVFSLIKHKNGVFMDTYIPNSISLNKTEWDLKKKGPKIGLRGVAIDIELGLIFVAAEIFGKILVFDIDDKFNNIYNITLGKGTKPINVINGSPHFPFTLFITDRNNDNGVYAIRYTKNDYFIWWQSERVSLLKHATGIAVSPDSLFVVSQSKHSILRYSPYSGHYLGLVVDFGKMHHISGEDLLYIPGGTTCTVINNRE